MTNTIRDQFIIGCIDAWGWQLNTEYLSILFAAADAMTNEECHDAMSLLDDRVKLKAYMNDLIFEHEKRKAAMTEWGLEDNGDMDETVVISKMETASQHGA